MGNRLFQHNTLGALMTGIFKGSLSIKELLKHGTMGIGTLEGLDGELIIIDGRPYQIKVDGVCHKVEDSQTTPYATVTRFEAENTLDIRQSYSRKEIEAELLNRFSSLNVFQAVKMTGTFKEMTCRSIEKQKKPYPRLVEVARDQAEFSRESVKGTLVGFYTPELFGSIAATGFHIHFLSEEQDFGGHVLDFTVENGLAQWQIMESLEQHFPTKNEEFMKTEIDYGNLLEEIEEAEK